MRILCCDHDERFRREVHDGLLEAGYAVHGVDSDGFADVFTSSDEETVVLLGPSLSDRLDDYLDLISNAEKDAIAIVFSHEASRERRSLPPCALVELAVPVRAEILVAMVVKAFRMLDEQRASNVPKTGKASGTERHPRRITVFSTKGGVGKTVIACNLAVCARKGLGLRTVLCDLDLQFGDVAVMMGLDPVSTIFDTLELFDEKEPESIEPLLARHPSGVGTLLAPVQPEKADLIHTAHVSKIATALSRFADITVFDTPPFFNDNVLGLLDETDSVLLVTTMDVPAIKNVKLCIDTLRLLGRREDSMFLVINRADRDVGLDIVEVERALGLEAVATIPSDTQVQLSVNRGVPIVLDAPRSPAARAIERLATRIFQPVLAAANGGS